MLIAKTHISNLYKKLLKIGQVKLLDTHKLLWGSSKDRVLVVLGMGSLVYDLWLRV
jgi:hypothetical protein